MVGLYDFIIEGRNFRKNSRKIADLAKKTIKKTVLSICLWNYRNGMEAGIS
jgi:hypothetical protein